MKYRVRLENGDFWSDDDVTIVFETAQKAVEAIDTFLSVSNTEGLDYSSEDIEIITADDAVLDYEAVCAIALTEGTLN